MNVNFKKQTQKNKDMKVGIYVMQKNEIILLPIFVDYYGSLFGYESICILDNGSDPQMKKILIDAFNKGCKVIYDYDKVSDFENKGKIIGELISKNVDKFNISIPLDSDEFIVLKSPRGHHISRDKFKKYFASLEDGAHRVVNRYLNNPYKKNLFYKPQKAPKYFFKNCQVEILDVGFHNINLSKGGKVFWQSDLTYFEFHNRSFESLIKKSKDIMKNRINLGDLPTRYDGNGSHLYNYLLWKSEEDYIKSIYKFKHFEYKYLGCNFEKLGYELPFQINRKNIEKNK